LNIWSNYRREGISQEKLMQVVIWVYCFVAETPDRDFAKAESFDGWIFWKIVVCLWDEISYEIRMQETQT